MSTNHLLFFVWQRSLVTSIAKKATSLRSRKSDTEDFSS